MAFDTSQFFDGADTATAEKPAAPEAPLVNQKSMPSGWTSQFFDAPAETEVPHEKPSLIGEGTGAFARGIDDLEAMLYGGGALTASWLGAEGAKKWFMEGYNANIKEAEKNPETVKSLGDAQTFDDYTRYGISAVAGFAPMVMQGLAASAIGGLIGSAAEPGGGTIAGGVTGLVARKSVQKLLSNEVKELIGKDVVAELSSYLEGKIEKSAMSELAQKYLTKEGEQVAKNWGATAVAGLANAEIMQGAIYGELAQNPDLAESDRVIASLIGGTLASIPMTTFSSTIAKAFGMQGVTEETIKNPEVAAAVAEKAGYFARFLTTGGKEIVKNAGHLGTAMMTQTAITIAASKWANPDTRWEFLNYSPADWQTMIDSTVKGMVAGGVMGIPIGAIHAMEHPDPAVRNTIRDVKMRADDVKIKRPDVTQDDIDLAASMKAAEDLRAQIATGTLTGDQANLANSDLMKHEARIEELQKKMGFIEEDKQEGGAATTTTTEPPAGSSESETLVNQSSQPSVKQAMQGMGSGAVMSLYDNLFKKLEAGDYTELGKPSKPLLEAKEAYEAGLIKSPEDLRVWTGLTQEMRDAKLGQKLPATDAERVADLRKTYSEKLAREEGTERAPIDVTSEEHIAKQADIDAHIEAVAGGTEYGRQLREALTPDIVNMMRHEDVHLATDQNTDVSKRAGFAADIDKNGRISLFVPHETDPEAQRAMKGEGIPAVIAHEIGHVAQLKNLRDEWMNSNETKSLPEFVKERIEKIGASTVANERLMPKVLFAAYNRGRQGNMSNYQIGQELPRMVVEMGRLGKTSEVTAALADNAEKSFKAKSFFRDWLDALKTVHGFIKKMIDPKTGNPELLKAADDMGKTLDYYGVLVNQKVEAKVEEAAKPTAEPVPAANAPPAEAPKAEILPSQQQKAAEPETTKAPTPRNELYKDFRAAIREKRGPTAVANAYLSWLKSKNELPSTKGEIASAHLDLMGRDKNLTMSQQRFAELAKQHIKRQDETAKKTSQAKSELAAEKAREPDDESEDSRRYERDISGEPGGEKRYDHPVLQQLAEKAKSAAPGSKLNAMRQHLVETRPELVPHFDHVVQETEQAVIDEEAARRIKSKTEPIRGYAVSEDLNTYQHAVFIPEDANETARQLAADRGLEMYFAGEDPPEDHFIVDTSGAYVDSMKHDPDQTLVNQKASVHWPVEITNKLDEAKRTKGILETHALTAFGHETIDHDVVSDLDAHFGENTWIVKSFIEDAMQGQGVGFSEHIKKLLDENPDYFSKMDTSKVMIQKLHDIFPSDRANNVRPGQEVRVHVLTDMDGTPKVIPFATFWKPLLGAEHPTFFLRDLTPVTIENDIIRAAHEKALESVGSLPLADRSGQTYGMDIVRTRDGGWGVVENNPTDKNGASGYMIKNPLAQDALLSALLGQKPVHAEMADVAHEAMMYDRTDSLVNQNDVDIMGPDKEPLVNQSPSELAAHMARPTKEQEEYVGNKIGRDWLKRTQEILDRNKTLEKEDPWNLPPANLTSQFEETFGSYFQPGEVLENSDFTRAAYDRVLQKAKDFAMARMRAFPEQYKDIIEAFSKKNPPQEGPSDLAAHTPRMSPGMEARLDDALDQAKEEFAGASSEMRMGERRTRTRGAAPDTPHIAAQDLEYWSQPQKKALLKAEKVIQENNVKEVINELHDNVWPRKYGLHDVDELDGGPNAGVTALYQTTMQLMSNALGKLQALGKDRAAQMWIKSKFKGLEANLRKGITAAGRATSMAGRVDKVYNGQVTRMAYVEPILAHLEKKLGPKGDRFVKQMADELNNLMGDEAGRAVMTPEVIAHLRNIMAAVKTEKFEKEARKTFTNTDKKSRQIVRDMASRLAAHTAKEDMGPEQISAIAQRMVKKLSGIPVSDPREVESRIFNETIKQVWSDNARKLGLIPESEAKGTPIEAKFASIMRDPELYNEFTSEIHRKMMAEYKPEPGSPFHEQLTELSNWMKSRGWSDGMVDSLVNKNMKELEITFGKLARERFAHTDDAIEKMKEDVRKVMAERGVDNEPLLDLLMEDLENSFRSRAEQARLDFFGSNRGVSEMLRELPEKNKETGVLQRMQSNLAAKAKEHSTSARIDTDRIKDWLAEDFGLPDTDEMPIASSLADAMNRHYNEALKDKREEIVKRMVDHASEDMSPKDKSKMQDSVDKILKLVNLGVFRDEAAYNALAPKFGLPPYSEKVADMAEAYGDLIAASPNKRITHQAKQELAMLIASQKGIKPYDMFLAGLYTNLLSGISTSAVNIQSNATSLAGYFATAATQDAVTNRGRNIPAMFRALYRSALGSAKIESADALLSGHTLHSSGEKFFVSHNVLEMDDPVFKSSFAGFGNQAMDEFSRGVFERAAKAEHQLYRRVGGKWVGRALNSQDVYFYKIAQEVAFASKTGITETPEMRSSAMMEAEQQMRQLGWDPNSSKEMKRKQEIMANQIINEMRLVNQNGHLDENLRLAWLESHHEALDATFRQDPKGLLGKVSKMIEKWTQGENDAPNPFGRLLIPFTRIAANVTNQMLEWTPYGLVRYGAGHLFGDDFRLRDESGKAIGRDPKILIRSVLGAAGGMTLMALFGKDIDDKDPYFAIYDDGSKNPQKRKQMMDAGWRPKTIKVGGSYISYTGTVYSMGFSIMGRLHDDYRDGATKSPYDATLSSAAVAMLQAVTHESFLSGLTDLMSAVDSPNPEAKMSRLLARMTVAPIVPNLAKQLDKWVNPTVQQAQGFWETFIREIPYARTTLRPAINVFGQEIKRDPGINLPGFERFLTMQKSDDPVYNILGEKRMVVPGFSKSTKLGDRVMTQDEFYNYVKTVGPELYKAIQANIVTLQGMTREEAQEAINEMARKLKEKARDAMRQGMSKS